MKRNARNNRGFLICILLVILTVLILFLHFSIGPMVEELAKASLSTEQVYQFFCDKQINVTFGI